MTSHPLSDRVTPPTALSLPSVDGLSWRPASVDDIDAITELFQSADRVDHPHYLTTRDEVADDIEATWVDLGADSLLAIADDGTLVAFGVSVLTPGQDTLVRALLVGAVHPRWRGRGIGRQLLAWQEQRALQQLASSDKTLPGWIMAFAHEQAEASLRLLARARFSVARYFLELRRDLDSPISAVSVPDGITIRAYEASDAEDLRLAKNDAFRDHWGSQPANEEQWRRFLDGSVLRLDLSFVAVTESGEIAGFVVTEVNRDDWEAQGFSSAYVDLVGVTRAWRGRRVAPALLAHALRAYAAEGLDKAVLDVDSESLTGALALYEGVGFVAASRSLCLNKVY